MCAQNSCTGQLITVLSNENKQLTVAVMTTMSYKVNECEVNLTCMVNLSSHNLKIILSLKQTNQEIADFVS